MLLFVMTSNMVGVLCVKQPVCCTYKHVKRNCPNRILFANATGLFVGMERLHVQPKVLHTS